MTARTYVVVPVFAPGPEVTVNVARMAAQAPVIAVDDGSGPIHRDAVAALGRITGVDLLTRPTNRGIAAALNDGIRHAARRGASTVITLDQDSCPPAGFVETLDRALAKTREPLIIAPGRFNGELVEGVGSNESAVSTTCVLQAGMAMRLDTFELLGGLDESLFIDAVDTDACLRLRALGGRVQVIPELDLTHTLGAGADSRRVRLGPFRPIATFHPPDRRYYITRNTLLVIARHARREPRWAALAARRLAATTILALTVEDQRAARLGAVMAGLRDLVMGRRGRRPGRRG